MESKAGFDEKEELFFFFFKNGGIEVQLRSDSLTGS